MKKHSNFFYKMNARFAPKISHKKKGKKGIFYALGLTIIFIFYHFNRLGTTNNV